MNTKITQIPIEGIKHDQAKPKYHLIDPFWYEDTCSVMTFGAGKYAEENWRNIESRNRVISSLERHLQEIKKGNYIDQETGKPHSAHIACNSMFLHYYEREKPENDNLFYSPKKEK